MSMNPLLAMMGGSSLPPLTELVKIPCAYCLALDDGNLTVKSAVTLYEGSALCAEHTRSAGQLPPEGRWAGNVTVPADQDEVLSVMRQAALRSARTLTCRDPLPHREHLWTDEPSRELVRCPGHE